MGKPFPPRTETKNVKQWSTYPSLDATSGWQSSRVLEVGVNLGGHGTALARSGRKEKKSNQPPVALPSWENSPLDTPDDQTLAPPAVTSSEYTLYVRREFLSGGIFQSEVSHAHSPQMKRTLWGV